MSKREPGDDNEDLTELSAKLVHDVSTPMAIVKMNNDFIARYLPALLSAYHHQVGADPASASIPAEHLAAIPNAPSLIEEQSALVENAVKGYWQTLNRGSSNNSCGVRKETGEKGFRSGTQAVTSLHILLVEDEAIHQDIALKLLSPLHNLDIATSGAEAVEKCRSKPYDLVLMDICLPDIDGRQITRRIRRTRAGDLTIIALSNMPISGEELDQHGFDAQLGKPLKLDNFTRCLQSARPAWHGGS